MGRACCARTGSSLMGDWSWLGTVDPVSVERERFNVDAKRLKQTEGTHLGFMLPKPSRAEQAAARKADVLRAAVLRRGVHWARVRSLENALARERRERAREAAWNQKLLEIRGRAGVRPFVDERGSA